MFGLERRGEVRQARMGLARPGEDWHGVDRQATEIVTGRSCPQGMARRRRQADYLRYVSSHI